MKTSGTFISDLKAGALKHGYFENMPEVIAKTGELGQLMSDINKPILDYLITRIDPLQYTDDMEDCINEIIQKHILATMSIIAALNI